MRLFPSFAVVVLLVTFAACGGSPTTPTEPSFSLSGTGNTVFNVPCSVSRVRITGEYTGFVALFAVYAGESLIINQLLGTSPQVMQTKYDGTHPTPSCPIVQVTQSTGVAWTFTEVRQ